jgi:hypothetical protein
VIHRGDVVRRSIVVLGLALAASLSACGTSSSTSTTPSPSPSTPDHVVSSHAVTGVDQLTSISCPTATLCEAVGSNALNGEGVVVTVTKGSPGAPHLVAGTKSLLSVSCPTPTICEAAGVGGGHGVVVPITGGTPGTPQVVQDVAALQAISCSSASVCQAAGRSPDSGVVSTGTVVHGVFGTTSVNAVACPNANCTSVASTSNGKYNDVLVPVAAGVPGTFRIVPPGTSTFSAIACPSASSCVVVGRGVREVKGKNTPEAVVLTANGGDPGRLVRVTDSAALLLQAVACAPGSHDCVAVGTNGSASDAATPAHGVFLSISGGVPGSLQSMAGPPVALNGIACPTASTCEAVGDPSTAGAAVVVTLSTS